MVSLSRPVHPARTAPHALLKLAAGSGPAEDGPVALRAAPDLPDPRRLPAGPG
ncbi:hypothetical protein ACIBF6_09130 [Streptosporangium amethystogenes]|uniref:hypothetical protein n=1 Tax=Streptosporangium amethystogenes TaxID=2002 RepID=UPI0037999AEB